MKFCILFLVSLAIAKALLSCNEKSSHVQVCRHDSIHSYFFSVETELKIMDIIQVNEDDKSITLFMYIMISWESDAYGLTGPDGLLNKTTEEPVKIPVGDYDKIRRPHIMIMNAYMIEKIKLFGSNGFNYFWFYNTGGFEYAEYLQVKLGCDLDFRSYPFDSHKCYLKYFDPGYDVNMMDFKIPRIYTVKDDESTYLTTIDLETPRVPFKVQVGPILNQSMGISMIGYSYNVQGLQFRLERSNIELLTTGFYIPTALFALISILALTVTIDDISDRIAVVLTIFLISMTLYINIKAPHDRGMSYVEVWIIGMQVPPIVVLMESTMILIKIRQLKRRNLRQQSEVNNLDSTDSAKVDVTVGSLEEEKQKLAKYDPITTMILIVYFILFLVIYILSAKAEMN